MKNTAFILSLALFSTYAQAEESIFGFTIGKRIEAPECPSKTIAGRKYFDVMSPYTCAWNEEHRPNDPLPSRIVVLAKNTSPSFMKGLFRAYIKDDTMVGVRFSTFGVSTQEDTFVQLTAKYGKPSSITKSKAQTLVGASFEAINAEWRRDGIVVLFSGVTDRVDIGEVRIETNEFFNMKAQQSEQKSKLDLNPQVAPRITS
jgi:hypothetical protein